MDDGSTPPQGWTRTPRKTTSWFVYCLQGRHLWRFIFFAPAAVSGAEAIDQAVAEARALGNEIEGSYMAAPLSALWTERREAAQETKEA